MSRGPEQLTARAVVQAFLPRLVARIAAADAPRPRVGASTALDAVIAFADLTGFTPLTERLQAAGPRGVERLAGLLDAVFGALVEEIHAAGGDVLRFAGDALLIVWERGPAEADDALVRRAAASCMRAAARVADIETPEGARLQLKVGIGAGCVRLLDVGGARGRWDYVAVGEPLTQVARAEHAARPGDVVLSPEARALVGDGVTAEPLEGGCWRVTAARDAPTPETTPATQAVAEETLRAYLSPVVLRRIDAGQADWLAEFRDVTMVFVNLTDPRLARGEDDEALRGAVDAVLAAVQSCEGSVSQVVVDDKGVVLVAAFGLPLLAHDDDAARAVHAALQAQGALEELGVPHRIGVASGRAFCGAYGPPVRRELVAIGDAVNLAARLMSHSDGVLCDEATAQLAAARRHFEPASRMRVKGRRAEVTTYRPVSYGRPGATGRRGALSGRTAERARLAELLRATTDEGRRAAVCIEAEPGLGKSALLNWLTEHAASQGVAVVRGAGDALGSDDAYHAWRGALEARLGVEASHGREARAAMVLRHDFGDAVSASWSALLGPVLGVEVPQSPVVREMSPALRGRNTHELLARMFSSTVPRLVAVDDAQWMDASSAALLEEVARRSPGTLIAWTTRPGAAPLRFADDVATERLSLNMLDAHEARALLCASLGAQEVDDEVADLVLPRSGGHPFFVEQFAAALRDASALRIEGGRCRIADAAKVEEQALPRGVQGVIVDRVDRLEPDEQLSLKVASVVGAAFPLRAVAAAHPTERELARLRTQFARIDEVGLTRRDDESHDGDGGHAFRHPLVQEATYGMLLFAQRRELHRLLAGFYEPAIPARAGRHWERAEDHPRAAQAYARAAEHALAVGANREAMALFRRAQAVSTDAQAPLRAAWFAGEAEAAFAAGAFDVCESAARQTLLAVRVRPPSGRVPWALLIALAFARQLAHVALGARRPRHDAHAAQLALAARAYAVMAEHAYHVLDVARYLWAVLSAVNAAESAAAPALVPRAYASISYVAGVIGLDRLRRRWFALGMASGNASQVPNLLYGDALHRYGRGELKEALRVLDEGIARARALNDARELLVGLLLRNNVLGLLDLRLATDAHLEAERLSRASDHPDHRCWALLGVAGHAVQRDDGDTALAMLAESARVVGRGHVISQLVHEAVGAYVTALTDRAAEARRHLARYVALARAQQTLELGLFGAYHAVLEAARALPGPEADAALALTREHLRRFAGTFSVGRARLARAEGLEAACAGRRDRARRCLLRSVEEARRVGSLFDEALARCDLAYGLGDGGPSEREEALAMLEQHGSVNAARAVREGRCWVTPQRVAHA